MLSERLDGWLRRHQMVVDGALALGLIGLGFLLLRGQTLGYDVALSLPLVARRRYPAVSMVLVQLAALAQWLIEGPDVTIVMGDWAVLISIYSVTAFGPRWAHRAGLAGGLVGVVLGAVRWPERGADGMGHVLMGAVLAVSVIGVWALGRLRGVRRDQVVALTERARLLETERDQRARLAVSAERARIAREMHDVVAHSLAVIIAQADGGRYAAADSPQAATGALETIGETGRRALGEMRRLLAVLREEGVTGDAVTGDAGAGGAGPQLGPQPGIGDLTDLVDKVRAGGLEVNLSVADAARAVDPGIGLVTYRIVQEGLTNVLKHAGPTARAQVRLHRTGPDLEVEVLDDGRGAGALPSVPGSGHGLMGMRERVTAFGGTLEVGPRRGGGYAVHARIPVTPS